MYPLHCSSEEHLSAKIQKSYRPNKFALGNISGVVATELDNCDAIFTSEKRRLKCTSSLEWTHLTEQWDALSAFNSAMKSPTTGASLEFTTLLKKKFRLSAGWDPNTSNTTPVRKKNMSKSSECKENLKINRSSGVKMPNLKHRFGNCFCCVWSHRSNTPTARGMYPEFPQAFVQSWICFVRQHKNSKMWSPLLFLNDWSFSIHTSQLLRAKAVDHGDKQGSTNCEWKCTEKGNKGATADCFCITVCSLSFRCRIFLLRVCCRKLPRYLHIPSTLGRYIGSRGEGFFPCGLPTTHHETTMLIKLSKAFWTEARQTNTDLVLRWHIWRQ